MAVAGGAKWQASIVTRTSVERTEVTATVSADLGQGITITSSKLSVTVYGLKGLEPAQFGAVAQEAERNCPVSNAYRGSLQISLDAKVG